MCQPSKIAAVLAVIFFSGVATSYGQSLGDVARQQRQKKTAKETHAPSKVITNEDIPEHPPTSSDSTASVSDSEDKAANPAPQVSSGGAKKTADQWKAEITAQKSAIAGMQSDLDRLNGSIHFVEANRYTNGVQYNQVQQQKMEQAQRMQKQLDQQNKRLEDMQEAARREGYGSAVYDP